MAINVVNKSRSGILQFFQKLRRNNYSVHFQTQQKENSELYEMIRDDNNGGLNANDFFRILKNSGITFNDPRISGVIEVLNQVKPHEKDKDIYDFSDLNIDFALFEKIISQNKSLINRALTNQFIIPEFQVFKKEIGTIYEKCRNNKKGKMADYIPILSKMNPNVWSVSICSVDGQRLSFGNKNQRFTLQSCSKPLSYALALELLGENTVHRYVGQEPSGRKFNKLILDENNKPHNPMVNAGAIMVCTLIKTLGLHGANKSEVFENSKKFFSRMAGGGQLTFDNSVYLSEKEAGNRNFALGFYMKEYKCFPEDTDFLSCMDFYFQSCTLEITTAIGAIMAATLAGGGICPLTHEQVIQPINVRNVLSLMYSCGMYDYSGQFAFKIGLPAKSGVSGGMLLVVPDLMGICTYSPPLDSYSCSVRGQQFCEELIKKYNFHMYDSLKFRDVSRKNPRHSKWYNDAINLVSMITAAARGDLHILKRHRLYGMDLAMPDYDGRTPLHLAAAEGQLECVKYLLPYVPKDVKDRWGRTPVQEAEESGHKEIAELIKNYT